MHSFIEETFSSAKILSSYTLVKTATFEALNREMRYELLRNSIQRSIEKKKWGYPAPIAPKKDRIIDADLMELKLIFNFLDLLIFENKTEDVAVRKNWRKSVSDKEMLLDEKINVESISCPKNSPNCVTLVIEKKNFV